MGTRVMLHKIAIFFLTPNILEDIRYFFGTLVFALRETLTSQKCHNAIERVLCIMEKALRAFDLMK